LYYARIGNANLRPEITNQYNIGITYALSPTKWLPLFSITADIFQNFVKDKIVAMPTKNLFNWTMVNLGKVDINGVDITAETSVNVFEKVGLTVGGTYTYQRALDITNPDNGTYLHQIPYTPRVSGSGKFAIQTPWLDVNYSLLWSGKRYALFQNYPENRLPAYSEHNISLSRDIKISDKIISVNFEILNLLNKNYAIVKWFPMPGRSVRGSVSFRF
jgi:outer membrane receptor protein involved in Fe transport